MNIKTLSLRQFRNIENQTLVFNPGLNVFRGQNGQGKTNIVEALYLLTHGRSFRTSRWDDFINKNQKIGFLIEAQCFAGQLENKISIKSLNGKKTLTVNSNGMTSPKLKQKFPSLLFSPESLLIVKDAAQKRRELIDDLCLSLFPGFSKVFSDYKKAYKQKSVLLKKIKEGQIEGKEGHKINQNISQLLFEIGSELTLKRLQAIDEIEPTLLQEFLEIMDEHYGNISINYYVSGQKIKQINKYEIRNAMYKRWRELEDREMAAGLCLVGPHKHDIQFDFNGQEARFFCSQGQQRAIILAFKMAQTKLHYRAHKEFPILLLDDVLSELDREKQMRFVNYLLSTEAQIFLTTTDATTIPQVASQSVFNVKNGVFEESDRCVTGGLSV